MVVTFYMKKYGYDVTMQTVKRIISSEKKWIVVRSTSNGNEFECEYSKYQYQLIRIEE